MHLVDIRGMLIEDKINNLPNMCYYSDEESYLKDKINTTRKYFSKDKKVCAITLRNNFIDSDCV